jgi:hypothetical protein
MGQLLFRRQEARHRRIEIDWYVNKILFSKVVVSIIAFELKPSSVWFHSGIRAGLSLETTYLSQCTSF